MELSQRLVQPGRAGRRGALTYAATGCQHGTHVAGIAAGSGEAFDGVAPSADLYPVQVFSKRTGTNCSDGNPATVDEDPCAKSRASDQIAALEHVYSVRNEVDVPIAAVNISIGGGAFEGNCDAQEQGRKAAIDNLRSAGIATVISSGNGSLTNKISAPACISSAVSVGNFGTDDVPSASSNSSSVLSLVAPGISINSSIPGGGFGNKSGTSMAAPHVTGAWAVLKQLSRDASVATVLSALQGSGKPVVDARNGLTFKRLRVLSAATRLKDTGFKYAYSISRWGGGLASNGVGLARRLGGPAKGTIHINTVPADGAIVKAYLYWMTIGGPDDKVEFQGTEFTGKLVGASRKSCWNNPAREPNRTYRADVTSKVTGNRHLQRGSHYR